MVGGPNDLDGDARGWWALASSGAHEQAHSGEETADGGSPSFTRALTAGLADGSADRDGDGRISIDELFAYATDRLARSGGRSRPQLSSVGVTGTLYMALSAVQPPPSSIIASAASESADIDVPETRSPQTSATGTGAADAGLPARSTSVVRVLAYAAALAGDQHADGSMIFYAALRFAYHTNLPGVTSTLLGLLADRHPTVAGPETLLQNLGETLKADPGANPRRIPAPSQQDELSPSALSVLLTATRVALETTGRPRVSLRHLVAATAVVTELPLRPELLAELDISLTDLRALVYEASRVSREDQQAWRTVLGLAEELATNLAGGVSTDRVDPTVAIPISQDYLDVGVWASMLAGVISDSDTPMPLSVGVFGEWGSGKSYFMGLLRSEVDRLSDTGQRPYLGHIKQIGFSAWHYADSNLWASLGDEIFRQLADPGDSAGEARRRLRAQLHEKSAERQLLQARTDQAKAESLRLRAELDEAIAQRQTQAVDLLHAVRGSAQLRAQLDAIWSRLGIRDEMEQAGALARELRGAVEKGPADHLLGQRRIRVAGGAAVVSVLAIAVSATVSADWGPWLARAGSGLLAVSTGSALRWIGRTRDGLAQLRAVAGELRAAAQSAADDRAAEGIEQAVSRLRRAEAEEKVTQAQLEEVYAQVGRLARQLSDLMPGQRLYTFLAERAASGPYAGQLNLVSTIRKDFEQLVQLLRDWHTDGEGDQDGHEPIDRIVLYIDDLDRCRPEQVLAVLQAVHLLLALDLFVVVVGVDPRWLLRSLRQQFDSVLTVGTDPDARADPTAGDAPFIQVTPHAYLEKIFNIPFVLPGVPAGGLERMLRGLANDHSGPAESDPDAEVTDPPGAAAGAVTRDPADRSGGVTSDGSSDQRPPVRGEEGFSAEPGSALAQPQDLRGPATRPLTGAELELLGGLDPLVRTPRDAKRLFNLYRMLRSTRDLTDASQFLGDRDRPGEYCAVALLLGMLTADATLLGQVLDAPPGPHPVSGGLMHRPAVSRWADFVADLAPEQANGGWTNAVSGTIPATDVPSWTWFARGVASASSGLTGTEDLSAFQTWAPRIRRFCFHLTTPYRP